MSVPWPAEFPCLLIENTQSVAHPALLRSTFDAGNSRQRRQHFELPHTLALSCLMTQEQRVLALDWFRANSGKQVVVYAPSMLAGSAFASDITVTLLTLRISPLHTAKTWQWHFMFEAAWNPADDGYVPEMPTSGPSDPLWGLVAFVGDWADESSHAAESTRLVSGGAAIVDGGGPFGGPAVSLTHMDSGVTYAGAHLNSITGDAFTLEGWYRIQAAANWAIVPALSYYGFSVSMTGTRSLLGYSGSVRNVIGDSEAFGDQFIGAPWANNAWQHFALVKPAGIAACKVYLGGVLLGSFSSNVTDTINGGEVTVGGRSTAAHDGAGLRFVAECRFTIGAERYTGSIYDIPTGPFPRHG